MATYIREIEWNPSYNSLASGKTFAALRETHKWLCTSAPSLWCCTKARHKPKRHWMQGVHRCCAGHEVTRTSTDISAAPAQFQPRAGKRTNIASIGEETGRLMLPCIAS